MKTRVTQRGMVVPDLGELPTAVGVYRVFSPLEQGSTVGSTVDLQKRSRTYWLSFSGKSKSGDRLVNKKLSEFVKRVGMENMEFEVLEHLPQDTPNWDSTLLACEAKWSKHFEANGGLLQDTLGTKWTEERKARAKKDITSRAWMERQLRMHQAGVEHYSRLLNDPTYTPPSTKPNKGKVVNAPTKIKN